VQPDIVWSSIPSKPYLAHGVVDLMRGYLRR